MRPAPVLAPAPALAPALALAPAPALALALALLLTPSPSAAQTKGDDMPDFMHHPVVSERRHGFTFGVIAGPSLLTTTATPTEYAKRNPDYEVHLGGVVVPSMSVFLGVAFADELSFALELEPSLAKHGDVKISGRAFAFRLETWPLVSLGKAYRDFGIATRFGFGSANFTSISTGDSIASAGGYSMVGVDLLWDALRLGSFGFGPTLGVSYRFSATYTQTDVVLGLRSAFYGGP